MESTPQRPFVSVPSGHASFVQSDWIALGFCAACGVLACIPLLFADRVPGTAVAATAIALVLVFVVRAVLTRSFLPRTAVDWPNMLMLLLIPVGLWASANLSTSWSVVYKMLASFAVFYGLAGLARSRWLRFLPVALLLLSASLALVVLLGTNWNTAKIPLLPVSLYRFLPSFELPFRPQGINPNVTGGAMALLLLPAVALAWWGEGRLLRLMALATASLLGLTLLISQSRGAWMATVGALVIMPWLRYRRWWILIATVLIAGVVPILLIGPSRVGGVLFPYAGFGDSSVNTLAGRLEIWSRALYLIHDSSLTGAGLGMFEDVVKVLYPTFFIGLEGGFMHAHNLYLQSAVELGVGGLVANLALLLGLAASLIAAVRHHRQGQVNPLSTSLAIGLFGSLLVYMLHGVVDSPIGAARAYALLVYALFGAAAALCSDIMAASGQREINLINASSVTKAPDTSTPS